MVLNSANLKKKKALITGASGFIGSSLALCLQKEGFEVLAQRNKTPLSKSVSQNSKEIICDLNKPDALKHFLETEKLDLLVHAAAISQVDRCEKEPEEALRVNHKATQSIAKYYRDLKSQQKPTLIYISTDMVFEGSGNSKQGFSENDNPKPLSVYAKSKLKGEKEWLKIGANAAIFRISLCYGSTEQGVLRWLYAALNKSETLNLYEDEWRTPLFVQDIAQAISLFDKNSNQGSKDQTQLFHLAGSQRLTRLEMGMRFAEIFELDSSNINPCKRKAHRGALMRAEDLSLNIEKAEKLLGFKATEINKAFQSIRAEKEC